MIIDLRTNGGGHAPLAGQVIGRFIKEPLVGGYYCIRNGSEYDDFTDLTPIYYEPPRLWQFTNPVIILTGQGYSSATDFFCLVCRDSRTSFYSVVRQRVLYRTSGNLHLWMEQFIPFPIN